MTLFKVSLFVEQVNEIAKVDCSQLIREGQINLCQFKDIARPVSFSLSLLRVMLQARLFYAYICMSPFDILYVSVVWTLFFKNINCLTLNLKELPNNNS